MVHEVDRIDRIAKGIIDRDSEEVEDDDDEDDDEDEAEGDKKIIEKTTLVKNDTVTTITISEMDNLEDL